MATRQRDPFLGRSEGWAGISRRRKERRRTSLVWSVEGLEDRCLLSGSVTVSTTNDVVDGTDTSIAALIASPGADGKISLREAIIAANNTTATAASPNIITVPGGTYTLTMGELDVTNHVEIVGAGSGSTIIEAGTSLATSDGKIFSFNPFNDSTGSPTGPGWASPSASRG